MKKISAPTLLLIICSNFLYGAHKQPKTEDDLIKSLEQKVKKLEQTIKSLQYENKTLHEKINTLQENLAKEKVYPVIPTPIHWLAIPR